MSVRQISALAGVLFKEEPNMACRLKQALEELREEGFGGETVGDLYAAFLPIWIEHTTPKEMLSLEGQKERQRHIDEASERYS